jgi:Cdc6-like AAA superfamily ATPase
MANVNVDKRGAIDCISAGHNVLILGQTGNGKTFVVKEGVRRLQDEGRAVAITASTGHPVRRRPDPAFSIDSFAGILELDGRFSDQEAAERVLSQVNIFCLYKESDIRTINNV